MRILLSMLLLVTLPGCLAFRMEQKLEPWLGRPVESAISEFGPPTSVVPNGDNVLVEWAHSGASHASANYSANRYMGYQGNAVAWTDHCRVWLDVDGSHTIIAWHWKGQCIGF
jgi:hypothetical protein